MSAPASASPAVVHNSSSGRPPHRAQSTSVRSTAAAQGSPHRALSQSQSHSRSNSGQQPHLQAVAKRDFEQSNVAQSSSSRRSESRDRASQSGQRSSSRSRHARYASEASTTGAPSNGTTGESTHRPAPTANNTSGRRRTTITATTGIWALGKTVGAGSMGKVKLARNTESGEQAWLPNPISKCLELICSSRLPSRLCPGSRLMSTATRLIVTERTIPRRCGLQGKRPS